MHPSLYWNNFYSILFTTFWSLKIEWIKKSSDEHCYVSYLETLFFSADMSAPHFSPFKALLKPLPYEVVWAQSFISGSLRYTTLPYYRTLASNQIRGIRKGQKTLIQWKTGNENWKTYPGCLRFFVACGVAPVSLLGSFTECTRETLSLRAPS